MADFEALAKLVWTDPLSSARCEFVLTEGATITIGRSSNNDIQIAEQHVSRQHAVIAYRDGMFVVTDLASSNGTFVNSEQITAPYPLFTGDVIRLYVPEVHFLGADENDASNAQATGNYKLPSPADAQCSLTVTNGPQEGQTIPLLLDEVSIGRATVNASWEILLQDPSVSRPHARLVRTGLVWQVFDLGSSNGTAVNDEIVSGDQGVIIKDGDTLRMGGSILLFRVGWFAPTDSDEGVSTSPLN